MRSGHSAKHENARVAAGVLVSAKSVGQFLRLRPANPAPNRPRAIKPSVAGSGVAKKLAVALIVPPGLC
jgi:hypothetical protein